MPCECTATEAVSWAGWARGAPLPQFKTHVTALSATSMTSWLAIDHLWHATVLAISVVLVFFTSHVAWFYYKRGNMWSQVSWTRGVLTITGGSCSQFRYSLQFFSVQFQCTLNNDGNHGTGCKIKRKRNYLRCIVTISVKLKCWSWWNWALLLTRLQFMYFTLGASSYGDLRRYFRFPGRVFWTQTPRTPVRSAFSCAATGEPSLDVCWCGGGRGAVAVGGRLGATATAWAGTGGRGTGGPGG